MINEPKKFEPTEKELIEKAKEIAQYFGMNYAININNKLIRGSRNDQNTKKKSN